MKGGGQQERRKRKKKPKEPCGILRMFRLEWVEEMRREYEWQKLLTCILDTQREEEMLTIAPAAY